jgi:hypothetical protein
VATLNTFALALRTVQIQLETLVDFLRSVAKFVASEVLSEVVASAKGSILTGSRVFLCTIDSVPAMLNELGRQDVDVSACACECVCVCVCVCMCVCVLSCVTITMRGCMHAFATGMLL